MIVIDQRLLEKYTGAPLEHELIMVRIRYSTARKLQEVVSETSRVKEDAILNVVIPADFIFSLRHVLSAFIHWFRSLRRGSRVRDPNIEFLRYYFAAKQIRDVKNILRRASSKDFVCIAYGDRKGVLDKLKSMQEAEILEDVMVGACDVRRLSKVFGVEIEAFNRGGGEISALELGILEKIALLDVRE